MTSLTFERRRQENKPLIILLLSLYIYHSFLRSIYMQFHILSNSLWFTYINCLILSIMCIHLSGSVCMYLSIYSLIFLDIFYVLPIFLFFPCLHPGYLCSYTIVILALGVVLSASISLLVFRIHLRYGYELTDVQEKLRKCPWTAVFIRRSTGTIRVLGRSECARTFKGNSALGTVCPIYIYIFFSLLYVYWSI